MCKFFKKTTWKVHTQKICTEKKKIERQVLIKDVQARQDGDMGENYSNRQGSGCILD